MAMDERLFYSFPAAELPTFDAVAQLASKCQIHVPDLSPGHYQRLFDSNPSFRRERNAIDVVPNKDEALRQEARSRLQRATEHLAQVRQGDPERCGSENDEVPFGYEIKSFRVDLDLRAEPAASVTRAVSSYFGASCKCTNFVYYPPGAFMGWHTNRYDVRGWRMYLAVVSEPHQSFFRYLHPDTGDLCTIWDATATTVSFFRIDDQLPFWHCVASINAHRWSLGFSVPEGWLKVILERRG
jgi:hypothetical protein